MLASFDSAPTAVRIAIVAALAVLLNAAYCLAYTAASGRGETLGEAVAWGLVNIAPWAVAIELGRQSQSRGRIAALLVGAFLTVIAAQVGTGAALHFGVVRALPGLAVSLAAIVLLRTLTQRKAKHRAGDLDIAHARRCEWIAAAGNYLELHGEARVRLARATLGSAAEALGGTHVRVHRSYLVRRCAIRRVDRDSVLLEGGKRLPLGAAYRTGLTTR